MFRKISITLLTLVAFFVFGFSVTANAKPPFLEDSPQMVVSPILWGAHFTCNVSNISDIDLELDIQYIRRDGLEGIALFSIPVVPLEATGTNFNYMDQQQTPIVEAFYCKVSWVGQPTDVTASFCVNNSGAFQDVGSCLKFP